MTGMTGNLCHLGTVVLHMGRLGRTYVDSLGKFCILGTSSELDSFHFAGILGYRDKASCILPQFLATQADAFAEHVLKFKILGGMLVEHSFKSITSIFTGRKVNWLVKMVQSYVRFG